MPVSDSFDRVLKRLKSIRTVYPPITVDGDIDCIVGSSGEEARVDVYTDHWYRLKQRFKKVS